MNVKIFFIIVAISSLLFACNDAQKNNVPEQKNEGSVVEQKQSDSLMQDSEEPVVTKVEKDEIEDVSNVSEKDLCVMFQSWLDKDGIFKHAPELLKLKNKVDGIATKQGSEVGYFDWDVWQETQDMPGKEIVNRVVMLTNNTAAVSVTIDDGYRPTERTVIISNESGMWKVIDFVSSSGKSFMVTCLDAIEEMGEK